MKAIAFALVCVAATACGTSYQSARVLAPGKTQVTAGLARTSSTEAGFDEGLWAGDLQAHTGVADKVEIGGRLVRTPGYGNTGSYAAIEGRFQVVPDRVSVALPVGIIWAEEMDDFETGAYLVTPYDLAWHVRTSWERIVRQLLPAITLLALLVTVIRFRVENTNAIDS